MVVKILLIFFYCSLSSLAYGNEFFNCQGDLIAFGFNGKSIKQLNSLSHSSFSIDRQKYLSVSLVYEGAKHEVANKGANTLIKVYPWNGIHHTKMAYAKTANIQVSFQSDKENWFKVTATKNSKEKQLTCKFKQF